MPKEKHFEVGDQVFHKATEDPVVGVVTAVRLIEVDWGPELGTSVHHENVLSTEHVPKFGVG
jgi:hypothetical protein